MKRHVARRIMRAMKKLDGVIGRLHDLSCEIEDETQRREFRRGLVALVLDSHERVTMVVVREYLDMHPFGKPIRDSYGVPRL